MGRYEEAEARLYAMTSGRITRLLRSPDPNLVQMAQQVGAVLIDPVRPGPFEFVLAIAARAQHHANRPGPPCGEQVPNTVPRHYRIADRHS